MEMEPPEHKRWKVVVNKVEYSIQIVTEDNRTIVLESIMIHKEEFEWICQRHNRGVDLKRMRMEVERC